MNGIVLSKSRNILKVVLGDGHVHKIPTSNILQSAPNWARHSANLNQENSNLPPGLSSSTLDDFQLANISPGVIHSIQKVDALSSDLMFEFNSKIEDLDWSKSKSIYEISKEIFQVNFPTFEQHLSILKMLFKKANYYCPLDPNALDPLFQKRDPKTVSLYLDIFQKTQFKPLLDFTDKCIHILTTHRLGERVDVEFSETDKQFIKILKDCVFYPSRFPCPERHIAQSHILPKLNHFYSKGSNPTWIMTLFKELGVWSPWENYYRQNPLYAECLLAPPEPTHTIQVKDECDGIRQDVGDLPGKSIQESFT